MNVTMLFFFLLALSFCILYRSLSVLVKDLSGKNLEVTAQRLIHDIEPSESYAKARDDQLVIMLRKSKWLQPTHLTSTYVYEYACA